ncbi:CoA transferase [Cryptosporangium sp. NPDC048952]|uniref:CaiB/BaiF CoA-transferase family protein n=1 Tax=Cryptosporangium sp. NPDC048952 TaxID=3363961 RepID=UPI003715CF4D
MTDTAGTGPLAGLVVIDLSTTLAGAQATQFLADSGADVVFVEPPGGSVLRKNPGWPGLLRGKRSITLDLDSDGHVLDGLLARADVAVATMSPAEAQRAGYTADRLAERYPRLVAALITGWGTSGPWAHYRSDESLVFAKTGVFHSKRQLTTGPEPAFVTVPYGSFSAAHAAAQGILAALIERDRSGRGQLVESDLVTAVGALDAYNWFYELVLKRYPGAFRPADAGFDDDGRPQTKLLYALLIAPTADGVWLQFAQSAPRLQQAQLAELGLAEEVADPKWAGYPMLPTPELRTEWWDKMLSRVGERTRAEWDATFARNPDVFGEQFRTPDQALEHPQIVAEGRVVTIDDPDLGPIRQPSTLVHTAEGPLTGLRRAPRPGEHTAELRQLATGPIETPDIRAQADAGHPLSGVTILELGAMFAGPYGATVLTDLGARVIKIEPLDGDLIRNILAYPEAGGAKVLQGKESVALDLRTPEGLRVLYGIAARCDAVLQCFRGGVAARLGVDEASLKAINPDLVYVNATGYGLGGPYGRKPAYAPSIGAASGVALVDAQVRADKPADREDLRARARKLYAGGAVPAVQADGLAAMGVASALILGLYAKRRGISYTDFGVTMLGSASQALISYNTRYAGRPDSPAADPDLLGTGPLHRMYRAADGWIFLAADAPTDWACLVATLGTPSVAGGGAVSGGAPGLDDARFATAESRAAHAGELGDVLSGIFATQPKGHWEAELSARDLGCVVVAQEPAERHMQSDEFAAAGYTADAVSPIFGEHRRLAPLNRFSRSRTKPDAGCTLGQHTDQILRESGYSEARIAELREQKVIS